MIDFFEFLCYILFRPRPRVYALKQLISRGAVMSEKATALLDRVTEFHYSYRWLSEDSAKEWLNIGKLISQMNIEEMADVFEALYILTISEQKTAPFKALKSVPPNPIDDTFNKLHRLLSSWFWTKVVTLDWELPPVETRQSIIDLVATVPHHAKLALMRSCDTRGFESIDFAKACLQQQAIADHWI